MNRDLAAALYLQAHAARGTYAAAAFLRCRGWSLASALHVLTRP